MSDDQYQYPPTRCMLRELAEQDDTAFDVPSISTNGKRVFTGSSKRQVRRGTARGRDVQRMRRAVSNFSLKKDDRRHEF